MQLPNVPLGPDALLNEYHARLTDITVANIRLTVMVHAVVEQRDNALTQMARMQEEIQRLRADSGAITRIGAPPYDDAV